MPLHQRVAPRLLKHSPLTHWVQSPIVCHRSLATATSAASHSSNAVIYTPAVLRLLHLHSISPESVPATGPKGRLLKGDVLRYLASPTASSSQSTVVTPAVPMFGDIPVSTMRKVIAKRLHESKSSTPHLYLSQSIRMDQLLK
jgi:pyruvate/2-oxoglutarate dehydrogenase complex dihydrolipoamide acyltransferase (E2) component